MLNEKMIALGTARSEIRELFEYGKTLGERIGRENVFDFTLGNPSVPCPDEVNDYICHLVSSEPLTAHSYTSSQGARETIEAVCLAYHKKTGFALDPDLTYMTCGAAAGLAVCLRAICGGTGDKVVALAPFFPEYRVFAENAGASLVSAGFCEDTFEVDIDSLARVIDPSVQAVIINSPNNPSGAVYRRETLAQISDLLHRKSAEYGHPIYAVVDEPYREILFDGAEACPMTALYDDVVLCYSYSKALSVPGERIGYLSVSPKATDANRLFAAIMGAGRSLGYVCAPSLFQKVVARYPDLTVDVTPYLINRDLLCKHLQSLGFDCKVPRGAFYLFVKSPTGSGRELSELAKTMGLLLVPGDSFGASAFVRIATCVSLDVVERSLPVFTRLADALKK